MYKKGVAKYEFSAVVTHFIMFTESLIGLKTYD